MTVETGKSKIYRAGEWLLEYKFRQGFHVNILEAEMLLLEISVAALKAFNWLDKAHLHYPG